MWIYVTITLSVLVILFGLYILSLKGRRGYADFSEFDGIYYAHRGLYGGDIPENSLLAFKRAKEKGYGAEFDVHLTADGDLAIIHDYSLLRTAGEAVKVEELTVEQLGQYRLEKTEEKIPLFREVLEVFDGELPLIIEIKATAKNTDKLCETVMEQLKDYKGKYCIESFDPRIVYWFKKNRPEVIRGQLSENYFKNEKSELNFFIKFLMSMLFTNFLTHPDFVAYRYDHQNHISYRLCNKLWGIKGVSWTVTEREELKKSEQKGNLIIFEDFMP